MKRLILLLVVAGLVAAIRYLPWWASAGVLVATPLLGWLLIKRVVMRLVMGAFEAKGAVLRGASARIRSIEPAEPWKPADAEDGDPLAEALEEPHHWVRIDLDVIAPEQAKTPMRHWEPGELAIVGEHAAPDDWESDESVGTIHGVERMEGGRWVAVEEKVEGSQRLRLHVSVRDGVDRFRLRYYFALLKNAS